MQTITIAAQKGGVGKTTLAVNLAVAAEAAGIRTALADLDPQESATAWAERRTGDAPHVEPLSARRLPAWLTAAGASGFGLAIIDTPPAQSEAALEAVRHSDLVLIPCRPSLVDLEAIRSTARLVGANGATAFVVFNAAPVSALRLIEGARKLAQSVGLASADPIIRDRAAFRHAWGQGQSASEYAPGKTAGAEIDALLQFMLAALQQITLEKDQA